MDKRKEIKKMMTVLGNCNNGCKNCVGCEKYINCQKLINAGYGDVKQAVREFAERLKESFLRNVFINGDVNVRGKWYTSKEVIREIIDELVKEVCGE